MKNVGNSNHVHSQGVPKIFRAPMHRVHCAVIFATAQLSCLVCIAAYTVMGKTAAQYLPGVSGDPCRRWLTPCEVYQQLVRSVYISWMHTTALCVTATFYMIYPRTETFLTTD